MYDKVIKCEDEEPNFNDFVYKINVYDDRGYTPCYYKRSMKMAFDRGFILKTKAEAVAKVMSLGW